jgi:hypothetical protein
MQNVDGLDSSQGWRRITRRRVAARPTSRTGARDALQTQTLPAWNSEHPSVSRLFSDVRFLAKWSCPLGGARLGCRTSRRARDARLTKTFRGVRAVKSRGDRWRLRGRRASGSRASKGGWCGPGRGDRGRRRTLWLSLSFLAGGRPGPPGSPGTATPPSANRARRRSRFASLRWCAPRAMAASSRRDTFRFRACPRPRGGTRVIGALGDTPAPLTRSAIVARRSRPQRQHVNGKGGWPRKPLSAIVRAWRDGRSWAAHRRLPWSVCPDCPRSRKDPHPP